MQKVLIVVSTAFIGAWAVLGAVANFTGTVVPGQLLTQPPVYWSSSWATFFLLAWILLGGIGIAAQYRSSSASAAGARERERTRRNESASR
jgi:hypothetical protein